jgi:hypothetical protein
VPNFLAERSPRMRGAPSGRVRLKRRRSLSAPRARRYVEPLPHAYRLFRGPPIVTGRAGPGLSNPGGGRRAPEVVRYPGRETRDHSFSDEVAPFRGSPQAPHPSPRGRTVPVTHRSWGRDAASLTDARSAGIRRGNTRDQFRPSRLRRPRRWLRPSRRSASAPCASISTHVALTVRPKNFPEPTNR